MIVGVDFDNTIVSYDGVFYRVALEEGLIPNWVAVKKNAVRDYLREQGLEAEWTRLQGEVYGARMGDAAAFDGVRRFFSFCWERGIRVAIISHKTKHPFLGHPYDLHEAAAGWIRGSGLLEIGSLAAENIFFETTKQAKIDRVLSFGCDYFIDDLPEILGEPRLRGNVTRVLFDPEGRNPSGDWEERVISWEEMMRIFLP